MAIFEKDVYIVSGGDFETSLDFGDLGARFEVGAPVQAIFDDDDGVLESSNPTATKIIIGDDSFLTIDTITYRTVTFDQGGQSGSVDVVVISFTTGSQKLIMPVSQISSEIVNDPMVLSTEYRARDDFDIPALSLDGGIDPVNEQPIAADDTFSVDEEGSIFLDLLVNDEDPDGDEISIVDIDDPANGSLTSDNEGGFIYTPDADFNGDDSFTYTVSDGELENTATISVTVDPVNDAPVANDDEETTDEDNAVGLNLLGNDTDVDTSDLTIVSIDTPQNGRVDDDGQGGYIYTPNANFNGTDTFTYVISDGEFERTATITVNVDPVNDAPVAEDDSYATAFQTPIILNVLENDSDVEDDPLTITGIIGTPVGDVEINGDGTLTYTPQEGFSGEDTFGYLLSDGSVVADAANVVVTVAGPDNRPPVPVDDEGTTSEDNSVTFYVLANDDDPDGDLLDLVSFTDGDNGTVADDGEGGLVYTPNDDFNGQDSFTYTVSDGEFARQATVTVNVDPVNDAPVAADDSVTMDEDNATVIDLSALVSDIDSSGLTITPDAPSDGELTDNGDGTWTYTPDADFNGDDSFTYTVSDGELENTATISVTVDPVNDAPIANDDTVSTDEDNAVVIDLDALVSDIDSETLTITPNDPASGELTDNGDGTWTYTPDADFNGDDSFTYTVSDGELENTATISVTVDPVNDAPVANDDEETTDEDNAVGLNLLGNDTDVDTSDLTIVSIDTPQNGRVDDDGQGGYIYTPNANFNGTDTFTYVISDGEFERTATITVNVDPVNDAPVAEDDSYATAFQTPIILNVLENDSDVEDDPLTITGIIGTPVGDVEINGDGTLTYTPQEGFSGEDTFGYLLSDGSVVADAANVVVTVAGPDNRPPVPVDDEGTTSEDNSVTFYVLANDDDPDGDLLDLVSFTDGDNGTVADDGEGGLVYTPNDDFNGQDSFTYTVSDGEFARQATVTVNVDPVNDAPVAADDSVTMDEDNATVIDLSALVSDIDSSGLTITPDAPSDGELTDNGDGTWTYTPDADFNGDDSFTYTVSDGELENTATISVTVDPVNDAPIANDDTVSTDEDNAVVIDLDALVSDIDSETLTITPNDPASGELTDNGDGTWTYTPDADFNGDDSFTYTVSDGELENTATISVTVDPVNDAPVANDDEETTDEDNAVGLNLLGNDTDVDTSDLTIVSIDTPQNGRVDDDGQGGYIYTPNANFNGTDTFTYVISDGEFERTATITVNVDPVNDAPVAEDDSYATAFQTPIILNVLENDSDVEDDPLTITGIIGTPVGDVEINGDGTLTYTPQEGFSGEDTFGYLLSDGSVVADAANVVVTVAGPDNRPPVPVDDEGTTSEDNSVTFYVLANDDDPDGDLLDLVSFTDGDNGTVADDGEGGLVYTPNDDFNGQDSFTYTVSDGEFARQATVTVNVDPVNDAPVAADDSVTMDEDNATVIDLSALVSDIDSSGLTITPDAPSDGELTDNGDGTWTYTPDADFNGDDSFTYTVSDGELENTATISVTVDPVNDAPIANDDTVSTDEDNAVVIDLDALVSDIDSETLTITPNDPASGELTDNGDGTWTYTPDADFNGDDSFTYTVSDGELENTATISVTVDPVNDAPVANDDEETTDEDNAVGLNLLGNDTDVDTSDLTIVSIDTPQNGRVDDDGQGGYIYTPNANFNGTDTFTYVISDGEFERTATITVNVDPVNDAPVAEDDSYATAFQTPIILNVLENDSDVEDDPLTITGIIGTPVGDVEINGDGTLTYTPQEGFSGEDTFGYLLSDGSVVADAANVVVTVAGPDNRPPVPVDDEGTTSEDNSVTFYVLANDDDPDGDLLDLVSFTDGDNGTVADDGEGGLVYTPNDDFNGQDSFTYTVSDGEFARQATVTVNVDPVNDAPVAADDSVTMDEDNATVIDLSALVSDIDSSGLTITPDAPSDGELTDNGDGTWTYTPDADFNGDDSFTYTVSDGELENTATISVTVDPVNDAPELADLGPFSLSEDDAAASFDILASATDVDGDTLTLATVSASWSGGVLSVTQTADGFTFDPSQLGDELDEGETGVVTVNYTVADGSIPVDGSLIINVAGADDDPGPIVIEDESASGSGFLRGTDADEIIVSGAGIYDRMSGGGGADTFVFGDETSNGIRERDLILDFEVGVDTICLSSDDYTVRVLGSTGLISIGEDAIYVRGGSFTLAELEDSIQVGCFDDIA